MAKQILYVVVNNHFDLTWRRCWHRPFTFQGKSFVSYTDLEVFYMLDNIAIAQAHPEYKFDAESVQVVRKFIERCPDQLPVLQQLRREGRFAITGGGEAIVDANMVLGESLVRNYVDGLLWVEKTFGQKTHLAVRNDAFGNSAQLPQVLRGCEIAWATGMSYTLAQGLYWRGLDGSTILHRSLPVVARGGGVLKYPPCAACAGTGKTAGAAPCPACSGRGIDPGLKSALPAEIDDDALAQMGAGLVLNTPEELTPNPDLPEWAANLRDRYDVRFALQEEALPHIQAWLERVDSPAEADLHPSVELNPNNSGVLVTRIQTKQVVRRQEHALLEVEALSVMAALNGHSYPSGWLKRIRQDQYFTMFHDAITATHVDAAYTELQEFYQSLDREIAAARAEAVSALSQPGQAGETLMVINPTGQPLTAVCTAAVPAGAALSGEDGLPLRVLSRRPAGKNNEEIEFLAQNLPPFSGRRCQVVPGAEKAGSTTRTERPREAQIDNGRYRIQADERGLVTVFDKQLERPILVTDGLRPAELVLEHDEGSPWATLHPDHTRTPLSSYSRLAAVEKSAGRQRLVFDVEAPRELGLAGKCLSARLAVTLTEGLERVDFDLHAGWNAFNHRLRVAIPVPALPSSQVKHIYEIPYGMLERQPYAPTYRWAGANGDWPAIHWAGVEQPGLSVALFNRGTPSYCMEAGPGNSQLVLLSLLRSPAIPTYLHEPEFYTMTDWDGMRDAGEHDFAFAVSAYAQPFDASSVVLEGEAYHASPVVVRGSLDLPALPEIQSGPVRIAALKWAEETPTASPRAIVLRLVEFRGQGGDVSLHVPPAFRAAAQTNLLERQERPLALQDGAIHLKMRPWEIATIKLSL